MFILYFYANKLMYSGRKSMKEIQIITKDGIKIAANIYNRGFESVLIISPGWFMTKDSKFFKEMGETFSRYCDVIIFDFRGHGRSSGFYTFTRKEISDIKTIIDYAKRTYKTIYLMGFSLGAAITLIAASEDESISKIIAVSAPVSFNKIENKIWKKEAWLPTFKKCELKRWLSIRPGMLYGKKIKPIDIVDNIKAPTLFIAGGKDPIVCSWHTKTLFDKATCTKNYKLFENCCHAEDLFIQDKKNFIKVCTEWLFDK